MENIKIIVFVVGAVFVVCPAVYFMLRTIFNSKADPTRSVQEEKLREITLHYVKDWFTIEMGNHPDRTAAIIMADRIQDTLSDILSEEVKEDPAHFVVLTANEKDKLYKIRLIHFETMDRALSEMLEKNNGIIKVGNK